MITLRYRVGQVSPFLGFRDIAVNKAGVSSMLVGSPLFSALSFHLSFGSFLYEATYLFNK